MENILSPLEQALVTFSLATIMMGMGTTLEWNSFKKVLQQPRYLVIGIAIQFGFMPLIAWSVAKFIGLSPEAAVALLLVGCTPGGASSNMYTWFAKGHLPLSLAMTISSTLLAVILMPLLVTLYATQISEHELVIPANKIMISLLFMMIPVSIGIVLRAKKVKNLLFIQRLGATLGLVATLWMLISWTPSLVERIYSELATEYAAVLIMGNCGFLIGLLLARSFGAPNSVARTISLETGLQNTLLTFSIMTLSFSNEFVEQTGWIPLMYGASIVGMGLIWMGLYRWLAIREIY